MRSLTVIVELTHEEACELMRIADKAARAARMNRMEHFIERIFQKLRKACCDARARHVVGEPDEASRPRG
jgi:hypothetical protein